MKITIEFGSMKDMLYQMPKFAQLVAGDGSAEERMASALEDDPTPLVFKITPKDGIPFTEDEKEAIRATISQYTDLARFEKAEKYCAELKAKADEKAAPEPPAEKPKKNPPKAKEAKDAEEAKPEETPAAPEAKVSETRARATLNGLVKARSNAAVKLVFHELGVKNFGDLAEDQYVQAVALAEKVSAMTDDEYAAALKEAGIKGGKK